MQAAEEEKRQREAKKKLLQKERKTLRRILKVRFKKSVQKSEPRAGAHGLLAGPAARPPVRVQCPLARTPARAPTCPRPAPTHPHARSSSSCRVI